MALRNAKPEILIFTQLFTCRKAQSQIGENAAPDDNCTRTREGSIAPVSIKIINNDHRTGFCLWQRRFLVVSVFPDPGVASAIHACARKALYQPGDARQKVWLKAVIRIEKSNVLTLRSVDTTVAGHRDARVRLTDETDIVASHSLDDFRAAIGRAVIDDNDLECSETLFPYRIDRFSHKFGLVI